MKKKRTTWFVRDHETKRSSRKLQNSSVRNLAGQRPTEYTASLELTVGIQHFEKGSFGRPRKAQIVCEGKTFNIRKKIRVLVKGKQCF